MTGLGDLYPFLADDAPDCGGARRASPDGAATEAALAEVRASTLRKARDIEELRAATWAGSRPDLVAAARLCAGAWQDGGTLLAFGNGGSATDARDLVDDCVRPPRAGWPPLKALDLTRDIAVITAVGNDVGFRSVFARQVIAFGREGDVAVGFSTSGESRNVIEAFRVARERGIGTIGFAGDEGGSLRELADRGLVDALIVAPAPYVPRIQEAHATAYHAMLLMARHLLEEAPA